MLEIKSLAIFYDKAIALENISMEVKDKEIVAVIGSNGAGKTTLLRGLSGLKEINQGKIFFCGERIDNLPYFEFVKKGIIHCPEGGKVLPEMSVKDNLLTGGFLQGAKENKKQLEFVYELFPKLKERSQQIAGTLSGGERQMVSLGRALMSKPKLLLLDEPSFGLAPLPKKTIYAAIEKINKEEGITILVVEQDASVALKLADRAYAFENGKVVMEGNPEALLKNENFKKIYLGL